MTALMPGAMQTGFAKAGGLADTKLFSNAVSPDNVARAGHIGMMRGSRASRLAEPHDGFDPHVPQENDVGFCL